MKERKPSNKFQVFDMRALKRQRLARGWTQEQTAKRVHVSTGAYCLWETGERQPHPRRIPQIAKVFGVKPLELTRMIDPNDELAMHGAMATQ